MKISVFIAGFLFCIQLITAQTNNQILLNGNDSCQQLPEDKYIVIGNIFLKGNNITKDRILYREIEFKTGDTLNLNAFCVLAAKSKLNLLNRSLFNFVTIDTIRNPLEHEVVDIVVDVIERWYLWPLPIFELAERNFNAWWQTKDLRRANYGVFLTYNNFRGRNELLKLLLRAGYNQNYFLLYEIPYLNRKQNFGMGIQMGHSQSREIPIVTENNQQVFYRHEEGYARSQWYGKIRFSLRDGIHTNHQLSIGYERYKFADTVLLINPEFVRQSDAEMEMFTLEYSFKHDYRDSKPYPLRGHYTDFNFSQRGFGALKNSPDYFTLKSTFDFYNAISKRWFWAFTVTGKYASDDMEPYFLQQGLGFGNEFVRSFELFVVDGQSFGLVKSNLKFALVEPRKSQLPFIKLDKFGKIHYAAYLNLLFDAGYVINTVASVSNDYQNRLIYGTGLGLDLVTYYDLVWRFEYSVNQFGKSGFFIHFVAPI